MSSLTFIGRLLFVVIGIFSEKSEALQCFQCPDVLNPEHCSHTADCDQDQSCFTHYGPYGADSAYRFSLNCISKSVCDTLGILHKNNHTNTLCAQCCTTDKCNNNLCKQSSTTTQNVVTTQTPTNKPTTTAQQQTAPDVTLQKQINITIGSVQHIPCQISGYPVPIAKWFFHGSPNLPSNTHVKQTDTGSELTIANALASNAGQYICYGFNAAGATSAEIMVNVTGAPPTITQSPHPTTLSHSHQKFVLHCRAGGTPTPSIKWTYTLANKYEMALATFYIHISTSHGLSTLYSSFPGVYTCNATNKYGTAVSSANVTINQATTVTTTPTTTRHQIHTHAPTKPVVTLSPHHYVDFGGQITLHCNVTGPRPLHITWRQVPGDFPPNVHQSGYDLVIVNAQPYNHKLYQCQARNHYGSSYGILDLSIRETKPVLFESPVSKTIDEGGSVSFTCNGTGYPSPTFEWTWIDKTGRFYLHQSQLIINPQIVFSADNTTIQIREATASQTGHLKCRCYNRIGEVTVDAQLTVIALRVPQIKAPQDYFTTNYGTDITITCTAEGYPKPTIDWKFNEVRVSSANVRMNETSVTIRSATLSNAGVYKCTANNKAGVDTVNFTLSVIGRGPSFTTTPPSSVNVYYGHSHDFRCIATGIPTPKITWSFVSAHGGNSLPSGTKLNTDHTQITMPSLTDFGVVTCIAENAYGKTTSQTSIYIKTAGLIG